MAAKMSKQYEKPGVDLHALCKSLNISPVGAQVSGGRIMHFRQGWAKPVMGEAIRVHYFERDLEDISQAKSLCGLSWDARWLYGAGNFDYCRRCKSLYKFRRAQ